MQTIPTQLAAAFRKAINEAFAFDADPLIGGGPEPPVRRLPVELRMGLAKVVAEKSGQKTNPRAVALAIQSKLQLGDMATTDIAGPGFINVKLNPAWICRQLLDVRGDARLGVQKQENIQRVVIDYSSPNVAKQMHVGHLRPTNIGDAISRIVEFLGHDLVRQNHLGDWGTQFGMLLRYLEESEKAATRTWPTSRSFIGRPKAIR